MLTQINGYVKYATTDGTDEFALWKVFLEMKTPQYAF